jgi:hypothetical protein
MTDGVVEARATDGELPGFDRVKAMTTQSADSIVQAAQDFGQDDDITVMTLRLAPVGLSKYKMRAACCCEGDVQTFARGPSERTQPAGASLLAEPLRNWTGAPGSPKRTWAE